MMGDDQLYNYEGKLIIGIDLGTTKSGVSVWDAQLQKVKMLPSAEGDEITPSTVAWDRVQRAWVAGEPARNRLIDYPADVVYSIKRCIGRWYTDQNVQKALPDLTYQLVSGGGVDQLRDVLIDFGARPDSPNPHLVPAPFISAQVLAKIRRDAAAALDLPLEAVEFAVISVPAYFDVLQRRATRLAGELAGLKVVDILNEPTAAALAYGAEWGDDVIGPEWRKILIYDLGGGTFDISILEAKRFDDGGYQVVTLGVDGDTRLGGDDIDNKIVRWLKDEIEVKYGRKVRASDLRTWARLRRAGNQAKEALSSEATYPIQLPQLELAGGSRDVNLEMTRAQLEQCAEDVLRRTREITQLALKKADGLTWDEIDQIILVGGQTLMPAIQQSVAAMSDKEPRVLKWPQQAVARGAGEYAHVHTLSQQEIEARALSHVVALPLGTRIDTNTFKTIVEANSTVPHLSGPLRVTTTEDNQPSITVEALQKPRDAKTADDCTFLGQLKMDNLPKAPKGVPTFRVQFDVEQDGTMKVIVSDEVGNVPPKTEDIIEGRTKTLIYRDLSRKS
jgi:molecular chaperone DnaK